MDGYPLSSNHIAEMSIWDPLFLPDYVLHLDVDDPRNLVSRVAGSFFDYQTGKYYPHTRFLPFKQPKPSESTLSEGEEEEEEIDADLLQR